MTDHVSLAEITAAIERVQAEKERLRQSLAGLEEEEVRLSNVARALQDFLEYRRAKADSGVDALVELPNGQVLVMQAKTSGESGADKTGSAVDRAVLALQGQAPGAILDTWGLIHRMQEQGFTSKADNVYLTVYGTLNRAAKRPDSRIVKVGSYWGLREWFPDGVPEPPRTPRMDDTNSDEEKEDQANADLD